MILHKARLIDQQLIGHHRDSARCEDALVQTPHHLGVLDGVTSKAIKTLHGKTMGQHAVEIISKALSSLEPDASIDSALEKLNKSLRDFYKVHNMLEAARNDPTARAAAALAIFSIARREVWLIGDCFCRIGSSVYRMEREIDTSLWKVRATVLKMALAAGQSIDALRREDPGRAAILPILLQIQRSRLLPFGSSYSLGVVDGFELDPRLLSVLKVPDNKHELVLATDGYPEVLSTLTESEALLAEKLREDPLCISSIRALRCPPEEGLSFDDRAFLRIALDQP